MYGKNTHEKCMLNQCHNKPWEDLRRTDEPEEPCHIVLMSGITKMVLF